MTTAPNRREVLTGLCALMLAGVGNAAFPIAAEAAGITKLKNGKVQIKLSQVPQLAAVGGVVAIATAQNRPIAITRTSAKKFAAFDVRCPHQGVIVDAEAGEDHWECSGHGAKFDSKTGARISGPAPKGLTPIRTTLKGDLLTVG